MQSRPFAITPAVDLNIADAAGRSAGTPASGQAGADKAHQDEPILTPEHDSLTALAPVDARSML